MPPAFVIVVLCLCVPPWIPVLAHFTGDEPVRVLTEEAFQEEVLGSEDVWLVNFFTDDCDDCKKIVPEYAKLAASLNGIVQVAALHCGKYPKLCITANVKHTPSIKLYPWEKRKNPYTKAYYKETPKDYEGPISTKRLSDFAGEALPSSWVARANATHLADELLHMNATDGLPQVVLFSKKKAVTTLYKGLSFRYRFRLRFTQLSADETSLADRFNATSFPALFVVQPNGDKTPYTGLLKAPNLVEFLESFAVPLPEPVGVDAAGAGAETTAGDTEEQRKRGHVVALNASEFGSVILRDEKAWVVAVVDGAGPHCTNQMEEFGNATAGLAGMVGIGVLNVSDSDEAARLAVRYNARSSSPEQCMSILLWPFGDDKDDGDPEVFSGPVEAKVVSSFALDAIPSFVETLTVATTYGFLYQDPGRPKAILFTSKTTVPDIWRVLSANLRTSYAFGLVHESEKEAMATLKVTTVPQVLVTMVNPSKTSDSKDLAVQRYPGPLKYSYLYAFLSALGPLRPSQAATDSLNVPEVKDDEGFQKHCATKPGICVIGLWDSAKASAADPHQKLRLVAEAASGQPFAFLWVDKARHPHVAAALDVLPEDAATAAVLSPRKLRYARLGDGAQLAPSALMALMDGVLNGRVHTNQLKELPSFTTASATPEEAGPTEPVEEEFSLEDILHEEVEGGAALGSKAERLRQVEEVLAAEAAAKEAVAKEAARAAEKSKKKKKKKSKKKKAAGKEEL